MAAHPSVELFHEPFTEAYYFGPQRRSARYGDIDDRTRSSCTAQQINHMLATAAGGRIFVKELAFQGEPYVNQQLIEEASHTFIARRPEVVAASLHKLKADFSEDEFGFTALARIFERCLKAKKDAFVIDGDDFRARPQPLLEKMCARMGVEFVETMLCWESGRIKKWEDHERHSQAKWHQTLERSTGILPPQTLAPDALRGMAASQRSVLEGAQRIYQDIFRTADVLAKSS